MSAAASTWTSNSFASTALHCSVGMIVARLMCASAQSRDQMVMPRTHVVTDAILGAVHNTQAVVCLELTTAARKEVPERFFAQAA